jgi:ribosomal protein S18 acetylase RimI-like enzyme
MISIDPATVADVGVLAPIGRETLLQSHGNSAPAAIMQAYVDDKFTEQALERELADVQNIFHIISHNGQPAGYSKIILSQSIAQVPQTNITKLERLYLLQAFYGLNLGRQLLDFNIRLAKEKGEAGMWLYVWKGNDRAIRFYQKAGFQIMGDGWFRLTDDHSNPNWQMFLPFSS